MAALVEIDGVDVRDKTAAESGEFDADAFLGSCAGRRAIFQMTMDSFHRTPNTSRYRSRRDSQIDWKDGPSPGEYG